MFAKTIVDSDEFLDMPLSTQALYFHLSMRADDDGFINNPKKIQRMIGATDGDAAMLIAKKFILAFSTGVIVIKHWRINNYLRSDRYHETVYQEEKKQLSIKQNGAYSLTSTEGGLPVGIPVGDQMDTGYTQYRIDKDSKDKTSINTSSSTNVPEDVIDPTSEPSEKRKVDRTPYNQIADLYRELCPTMNKVRPIVMLDEATKSNIRARWAEYKDIEVFRTVFTKAEASDWLNNRGDASFQATFGWLMGKKNFSKCLNGLFDPHKKRETIKGTDIEMSLSADGSDRSKYVETGWGV